MSTSRASKHYRIPNHSNLIDSTSVVEEKKTLNQSNSVTTFFSRGQLNKAIFQFMDNVDIESLRRTEKTSRKNSLQELNERFYEDLIQFAQQKDVCGKSYKSKMTLRYKNVVLSKDEGPAIHFPDFKELAAVKNSLLNRMDKLKKLVSLLNLPLQPYLIDTLKKLEKDPEALPKKSLGFLLKFPPFDNLSELSHVYSQFSKTILKLLLEINEKLVESLFNRIKEKHSEEEVLEIVKSYLPIKVDLNCSNYPIWMYAIEKGFPQLTKLLLQSGANVNKEYWYQGIGRRSALIIAIEKGNVDLVKLLISANANVNQCIDDKWPLSYALSTAKKIPFDEIARCLMQAGADINSADNERYGNTALITALDNERFETAKFILNHYKNKVDINYANKYNETALMIAAKKGNFEMVKLLIENGADVSLANIYQETAEKLALESASSVVDKNPLMLNKYEKIIHLIQSKYGDSCLPVENFTRFKI